MSGYQLSTGADLDTIFQLRGNATATTTGYKLSDNTDLGARYLTGATGDIKGVYGTNINYKFNKNSIETDVCQDFQKTLPFTVSNALIFGTTTGTRYCYAVFTNTNADTCYLTIQNNCTLNMVCVGGGGGGGTRDNESPGGGGICKHNISCVTGNYLRIRVGFGGTGGTAGSNGGYGTSGGDSTIELATTSTTNDFSQKARGSGGGPGHDGGKGAGGLAFTNGSSTSLANDVGVGGDGGDESNGENSYYREAVLLSTARQLDVPAVLTTDQPDYIQQYYSGGGGGSKAANTGISDYQGGRGGGKDGNIINGFGGARGLVNGTPANGQAGQWYGGGGGSGGAEKDGTDFNGGAGHQGIVFVWSEI